MERRCDKQLDEFMYNAYNEVKGKVDEVSAVKGFNIVDNAKDKIEVRHVVRLNSTLKVSYKAMLKRLVQLD